MTTTREKVADFFTNRLDLYVMTHFGSAWELVQSIAPVRSRVNRLLISRAILKLPTRPDPFSTMAPYTSWDSLTDRTFFSRHLPPPRGPRRKLPCIEHVADLFKRRREIQCPKSTVLFSYFAQWFTDGFVRSDRAIVRDLGKNASNHNIDLSQLYGPSSSATRALRTFEGGRLKSQVINGEEYPCYLCDENGEIKDEFEDRLSVVRFNRLRVQTRRKLFAIGSDTANLQLGFLLMNVLFLREHNRIARLLALYYPKWDDEELFSKARNVLTVLLINIVVEEYINHIAPYNFRFTADPAHFRNERWYRENRMAIEFNLLYRWHSLVPSSYHIEGNDVAIEETLFSTELLTRYGLGPHFEAASEQPAGRIGLFNTDPFLRNAEVGSIHRARALGLASYNDYRAHCRFPRVTDFDQISDDPRVQSSLRKVYGSVDRIEFYVGLFAEQARKNSPLAPLMGRMVGVDAFSQAFTNPLLAPRVFNDETFSPPGMQLIRTTRSLSDLLHRNLPDKSKRYLVTMTRPDWERI